MLSSAAAWISYGGYEDYYVLGTATLGVLRWISEIAEHAYLIVCGLGLCLLARDERRYPDRSREVRAIVLTAGVLVISLGLVQTSMRHTLWMDLPSWGRYILSRLIYGPWIPLIIGLMAGTYVLGVAKRGNSRRLLKIPQLPAWPVAGGLVLWLLSLDRMIWPLRSLVWSWLFPLSVIVVLVPTIRVLLRGAREAEANWGTDP